MSKLRPQQFLLPIHPEGWVFVVIAAFVTFLLALINGYIGILGALITGWITYFFRDPQRFVPNREGLIVSAADGVISAIVEDTPPAEMELKGQWIRVSTFLNIFDVHVNRVPIGGEIVTAHYRPGKFLNAALDKASEDNERQSLVVETKEKVKIGLVQIAGLIARRIVCEASLGKTYKTGERFGIIRFGSRVDIYLPKGVAPLVLEGQRVIAGETIIADLTSKETARHGEAL